jgi:hypothetical protein
MNRFSIILLFVACTPVFSQGVKSISINVKKKEIKLDGATITEHSTVEEMIKALGKPTRVQTIGGKERFQCYDEQGIAFEIAPDGSGKILAMTITYQDDGDVKVAKGPYTGTLAIDSYTVTPGSTSDEMKDKTDLTEFHCMSTICISDLKQPIMGVMVAYTPKHEISQISFVLVQIR